MSLSQSGFESRGLSSPIWRGRRGRRCLCRFRLLIIHDQPRTALSGQEQPAPLQEHADFQTELRQKRDVNESPAQPRNETVQPKCASLQNCVALADDGHGAFLEVTKRLGRPLAGKLTPNQFSSVASLLHCNLSDARQRFSVLIERGRIADHENFRMIWNSKIGLDTNATSTIRFGAQPFSSRRRCDTGRPDDRFACYALAPEDHPFAVDLFDRLAQVDFDAEFLQMGLRGVGDRKSTRLNSSHVAISYAVFCLKKKILISGLNIEETLKLFPTVCHAAVTPVIPYLLLASVPKCHAMNQPSVYFFTPSSLLHDSV